jgi:hypothetical protein
MRPIHKLALVLTPVFWVSSVPVASYGIYLSVLGFVLAGMIIGVVSRFRDDTASIAAPLMFAAIWWPLHGAAAAALCIVIGLLAPRRTWYFAAVAAGAMVALAVANPPVGPVHLATISALVVVHALLVGVGVLVEVKGRR